MTDDFFSKNRTILIISFSVIVIVTFYPLLFTGFACADDLQNYLVARWGNYAGDASNMAKIAGRFYYYIVKPLNSVPYSIDNMYVTKLYQIIPIIICLILFARVLFVMTKSKEMSFLYFLLFLVTAQISGYTSLFVTYPFYYSFSFCILLVSFLFLIKFLELKKKSALLFSVILYTVGLLFYETHLLFLIIIALTILYYDHHKNDFKGTLKRSAAHFSPFLGVAFLYLAIYFIYRVYHPSYYDGTSFNTSDFKYSSFFQVLWSLSYSSFPLQVFEWSRPLFNQKSELVSGHNPVVLNLILNSRLEWLIKGAFVAITGYLILLKMPKIENRTFIGGLVISILLIFTPHIPLALTSKYIFYVSYGMIGYVTTFFSLFGVVLLLTLLFGDLMSLFEMETGVKKMIKGVVISVLLIIIPQIIVGLIPKNNFYVIESIIGYVSAFITYFGLIRLVTVLLVYFGNLFRIKNFFRKALSGILVFGLFICSVLTDFSNYTIAKDIRSSNIRLFAMDELIKSEMFLAIPNNSKIYAKDLYNTPSLNAGTLTGQSFNWGYYIEAKSKRNHFIFKDEKEFLESSRDSTTQSYYIKTNQALKSEEMYIALAMIRPATKKDTAINTFADKVWILNYSPYTVFTISFRCKQKGTEINIPYKINHIKDTIPPCQTIQLTIYNTRQYQTGTLFSIQAESIDLNSIIISDLVDPKNRVFYL